jgi:hypothetical protein
VSRPVRTSRFCLAAVLATLAVAAWAPIASACSGGGYGYAGLIGADISRGIRATVSARTLPRVESGHAAAWVGVGGRGAGPNGEDEWLQVGLAAYKGSSLRLYYELMQGTARKYVEVDGDVPAAESHRVAVGEVRGSPGWWRVWVDRRPVIEPVYLAGSHRAWRPIATAENWSADCVPNAFHFGFRRVEVRTGRSWKRMAQPFLLADAAFEVVRRRRGFDALTTTAG